MHTRTVRQKNDPRDTGRFSFSVCLVTKLWFRNVTAVETQFPFQFRSQTDPSVSLRTRFGNKKGVVRLFAVHDAWGGCNAHQAGLD